MGNQRESQYAGDIFQTRYSVTQLLPSVYLGRMASLLESGVMALWSNAQVRSWVETDRKSSERGLLSAVRWSIRIYVKKNRIMMTCTVPNKIQSG